MAYTLNLPRQIPTRSSASAGKGPSTQIYGSISMEDPPGAGRGGGGPAIDRLGGFPCNTKFGPLLYIRNREYLH